MTISPYEIQKATMLDAEGIAHVHVKGWQTSYVGIIDQSYLDTISYDERLDLRKKILSSEEILSLVVTHNDKIIGFADAGPLRPTPYNEQAFPSQDENWLYGEIYGIYLLQEHQRKELGHKLYQECKQWFKAQNYSRFVTWVLTQNIRARRFYESEGGKISGEMTIKLGDKNYQECCYVFENGG